jgi:DNA-binding IclR family transcriptional regulator
MYRTLTALEDLGMVRHNPETGVYRLGLALWTIVAPALAQFDVKDASEHALQDLSRKASGTTTLALFANGQAVVVAQGVPSSGVVVLQARLVRFPIHTLAGGKILLAYNDDYLVDSLDLTRITDSTITDRAHLRTELETIKDQGYVLMYGEAMPDVGELAAPVRDYRGEVVGVVGLSLPSSRWDDLPGYLPDVLAAAAQISKHLGYLADHPLALNGAHPLGTILTESLRGTV